MLDFRPSVLNTCLITALLALTVHVEVSMPGAHDLHTTPLLADARDAKMARQGALAVKDHYGNPALFVKYIIRRPQTLA
ncbi:MAG: hypothetical protein ACI9SB_000992 [Candidatus Azotimanducaceae bacterium]|jgi:hypothetical protein